MFKAKFQKRWSDYPGHEEKEVYFVFYEDCNAEELNNVVNKELADNNGRCKKSLIDITRL